MGKPVPSDGYYLYYAKEGFTNYNTVYLMARKDGHTDRRVAIIQEMAEGEVYLAFLTKLPRQPAFSHKDAQTLITNVCTYDRLTSTTKG